VPGIAAAGLLTARRGDGRVFVLPQVPSEPGPLASFGQQVGVTWVAQGFSRVTPDDVDVQVQWVNVEKSQASAVARFSGPRADLPKVLDQVRRTVGTAWEIAASPAMPPPVWNQTRSAMRCSRSCATSTTRCCSSIPPSASWWASFGDPIDYLREAVKSDRAFRAAADALAAENRGEVNSFGPVLEIGVEPASLL